MLTQPTYLRSRNFEMTKHIRNCVFAFKCEQKWDELKSTKVHDIKFCMLCQREVFFCRTDQQLRESISLNRCISIEFIDQETKRYHQLTGSPARSNSDDIEDDVPY